MKVTEVSVTRKTNLGNYESEDISVTVSVDEGAGDNAQKAVARIRKFIADQYPTKRAGK